MYSTTRSLQIILSVNKINQTDVFMIFFHFITSCVIIIEDHVLWLTHFLSPVNPIFVSNSQKTIYSHDVEIDSKPIINLKDFNLKNVFYNYQSNFDVARHKISFNHIDIMINPFFLYY